MSYRGTYTGDCGEQKYDRYMAHNEQSTIHKIKESYWTTKQYVKKKLGKKEDEHVVASDSMLDSKLEVFKAIQKSCMDLLRCIEKYQDRLCALSQEENAMGRFLKNESQHDKTRAGKMMVAVGKAQSHASQQRLALRVPLVRLFQEVETFRYRAISDTLMTINRMEAARTEYRGALLWMKDVSEELDPDTYKQLEKFRKVQAQVKKTKARFDKLKLDTMQKIDLLAASRCNMFSHVLANYQTTLLHFWEKTSRTHSAVAESFKGYQYYEFNLLKELAEPSKKLAAVSGHHEIPERDTDTQTGLMNFDGEKKTNIQKVRSDSMTNLLESDKKTLTGDPTAFIDFGEDEEQSIEEIKRKQDEEFDITGGLFKSKEEIKSQHKDKKGNQDLLTEEFEPDEPDKDDLTLLNEILNAPTTDDDFTKEWQAVFGDSPLNPVSMANPAEPDKPKAGATFMPSNLLDLSGQLNAMNMGQGPQQMLPNTSSGIMPGQMPRQMVMQQGGMRLPSMGGPVTQLGAMPQQQNVPRPKSKKGPKADMSAWFNLFADLDPLSNPDAIGKEETDNMDAL